MTILFSEKDHRYFIEEDPSFKFTSVSKVIEHLHEKFDEEKWSLKKAKERGISQEEILKEWEDKRINSQKKGTAYHAMREEKTLSNKNSNPSLIHASGNKQAINLKSLSHGIYPELILYHLESGVIGTADYVEIYPDKTFDLKDYKTNDKIEFKSFKRFDPIYKDRVSVKMLHPISHLEDCKGIHYTIQLSLYAYMLEQFGYTCKSLTLLHAILDDNNELVNEIEYSIPYLKKESQSILKWFKTKSI